MKSMNRKRIATLGVAALLLVGAGLAVHAEGHGFHGSHGSHGSHGKGGPDAMEQHAKLLVQALGLSDEQHAAAMKIHEEVAAKAAPLTERHHQQMEEVHALLDGTNPDPTEIGQKLIAAHATKKELRALHEDAMARFTALLDAEQQVKLKKLHEEHGDDHGHRGPFGHPGPDF